MEIRLSENDIEVLMFLGKYKIMKASSCNLIYKSKCYPQKRLKKLEKEKIIKRVKRLYIKLDNDGIKLINDFGYDYDNNNICRNKKYEERIREVSKIATLTLNSNIEFIASWDLKDNRIFTETSRKYLGKLIYKDKEYMAYYISKHKSKMYIRQIINDIQKVDNEIGIIIFLEDEEQLNDKNFIFGKANTIIIKPTIQNLSRIRQLSTVEEYSIIEQIYPKKEILLSDWKSSNYMTEYEEYIILMPFIDTEKLYRLNIYFYNNKDDKKKITIITFEENKKKIEQILIKKVKFIEIDKYLGGMNESFR